MAKKKKHKRRRQFHLDNIFNPQGVIEMVAKDSVKNNNTIKRVQREYNQVIQTESSGDNLVVTQDDVTQDSKLSMIEG